MESSVNVTPRGRAHAAPPTLIKPKALSAFLRLALGDGVDAVGFVDNRAGRILGWEEVDESKERQDVGWLLSSLLADGGVSNVKGHRVASVALLQGRFSIVLVSFGGGSGATPAIMTAKLDEMKRTLESQHAAALLKLSEAAKGDDVA